MEKIQKLLIVNNNLEIGGIQQSLVNLLEEIGDMYDITLFLFNSEGGCKNRISSNIKVLQANPFLRVLGMSQAQARKEGLLFYAVRSVFAAFSKVFNNHIPVWLLCGTQKKLKGFDVAISFMQNTKGKILYGGCNEFVINRVKADKKVAFIHCDFISYGGNTAYNRKLYQKFDAVAAVSQSCKTSFCKADPAMESKTFYISNCHDYNGILEKASKDTVLYRQSGVHMVTVARLAEEKGLLRALTVVEKLVKEGHSIFWHIVGDGVIKEELESAISVKGLSGNVFMYGQQSNPYRFIKNADVFLLASFHEAAPMVIAEAMRLGVPVISTATVSANEMIRSGTDGIVCENSESGIYKAVKQFLDEPDLVLRLKEELGKKDFSNETPKSQFAHMIENL